MLSKQQAHLYPDPGIHHLRPGHCPTKARLSVLASKAREEEMSLNLARLSLSTSTIGFATSGQYLAS
jgi:hypothetical protein